MAKIETVQMYKTDDGELWETKQDAENHLSKLILAEKIDSDLYCRDTSAQEIAEWIIDNLNFTFK